MNLVSARKNVADADWLGTVPSSWEARPLFTVLNETDLRNSSMQERNLLSLSYGKVIRKDIDTVGGLLPESFETYQIVQAGDIVLRLTDLQNDQRSLRVGLVRERGIITSAYVNLRPRPQHDSRFLFYQLHNADICKVFYNFGGGVRQSMKFGDLKRLPIVFPPCAEQREIADFLDRETRRLDELIQRKTQLLTKFEEQHHAITAHAVTKGLPPAAAHAAGLESSPKLKQTGVDWLGAVPEHWRVMQLKWVVGFQRGHDLPSDSREEGHVPVVSSAGIIDRHSVASAEGPGIVTGRYGSIGEFYLIEEDYWPLNTTLYSTSIRGNHPRFVLRMLENLAPLFLLNAVKSAVPGVDRNDINPVLTAVPPLDEQFAIASFLDREEARSRGIVGKVEVAIQTLKDYRSALISAAVTGQIDVRNYRRQEAAALCQ